MDNQAQINIGIVKIQEVSFSSNIEASYDTNRLEVGFSCSLQPDPVSETISVLTGAAYRSEDKILFEIKYSHAYQIKEFKDIVKINDDKTFECAGDLIPTLIGVSFGTLRGIVHMKTLGTLLNNFPIPIVNATDLLQRAKIQS